METFSLNREFEELVKQTIEQNQLPLSGMAEPASKNETDELAKNRYFFQDNNAIKENSNKPYATTHIKSRNFLSNISYVGVTKQD